MDSPSPCPTMKDSGAEWLGDLPAHWGAERIKNVVSVLFSNVDKHSKEEERAVRISQHLDKRRHVESDDFVISMRSFQGGLERAWTRECIRSSYVVLCATTEISCDFFGFLFKSAGYINAMRSTADFIRDGQDLNFDNFCRVDLPFPPLDEQRRIGKALNKRLSAFYVAIEKSRQEMALLTEFRQRLVADVVTGRLDVRQAASDLLTEESVTGRTDVSSSEVDRNLLASQRSIVEETS